MSSSIKGEIINRTVVINQKQDLRTVLQLTVKHNHTHYVHVHAILNGYMEGMALITGLLDDNADVQSHNLG